VWIDIVVAARRCAAFGPGNASIFPRHARMNRDESFTHLVERHVLAIGDPFERIRSARIVIASVGDQLRLVSGKRDSLE
jgi:hypothetical protein